MLCHGVPSPLLRSDTMRHAITVDATMVHHTILPGYCFATLLLP